MKLRAALQALASGKIIRSKRWSEGVFIYEKDNVLLDENGSQRGLHVRGDEEFEVVESPKEIWVNEYNDGHTIHLSVSAAENLVRPNIIRTAVKYREVKD